MRNAPETRKAHLISDLAEARRAILDAVSALADEDQDEPFLGTWSAHDIVAHLIGWDYANLEAIEAICADHLPAFYSHYDPDWRTFNAGLVAQHKRTMLAETLAAAQTSHQALLARLAALPAEVVSRDHGVHSSRGRRVTIAMLLGVEASDERKHASQIEAFAMSDIVRLRDTVDRFSAFIQDLPTDALADQEWGPKEVLAHLVFHHELYVRLIEASLAGTPAHPPTGTFRKLNAQAVAANAGVPLSLLVARLQEANRRLEQLYLAHDPNGIVVEIKAGATPRTLAVLVPEVEAHIRNHLKKLQHLVAE